MLIDTDVLIWNLRGHEGAASLLDDHPGFLLSAVSYMEILQGVRDKEEQKAVRRAIHYWRAEIVPIDSEISSRALFLVETWALSHNLQMADALIAATALDRGAPLTTANDRHYRHLPGIDIRLFRP